MEVRCYHSSRPYNEGAYFCLTNEQTHLLESAVEITWDNPEDICQIEAGVIICSDAQHNFAREWEATAIMEKQMINAFGEGGE